jgi:hypothetical protein
MATILGGLADALVAELEAPQVQSDMEALIASGEVKLEDLVLAGIQSLPKPGGLLGMFAPAVVAAEENYVKTVVAKYTPAEIVAALIPLAQAEAKRLGG